MGRGEEGGLPLKASAYHCQTLIYNPLDNQKIFEGFDFKFCKKIQSALEFSSLF